MYISLYLLDNLAKLDNERSVSVCLTLHSAIRPPQPSILIPLE